MATYNGQAGQDYFALMVAKHKRGGTFVELGSNDPILINNTYLLERDYGWRGLMVEYDAAFVDAYDEHRPASTYMIADATNIDYAKAFRDAGLPQDIDYLQIDLEVSNRSTLTTLERLDEQVLNTYRFATVTFEHDIYAGDYFNTRIASRAIFDRRGYVRVFSDIMNEGNAYEDWYVHPALATLEPFEPSTPIDYKDALNKLQLYSSIIFK
jgi:hypothetical protein